MENYKNFTNKEFLSKIEYGLIVVEKDEEKRFDSESILFYHFVGYITKPTEKDITSLYEELKSDPEFKLENIDELTIIDAPNYVVKHFKESKK